MKKVFIIISLLFACAGVSMAQHGDAEPGYYPLGYNLDTWTGEVTSVNEDTREFTLTYKKRDKEQTFVGVLPTGYKVRTKDGSEHEIKMAQLMGLRITVYYKILRKKVDGQKVVTNEVFQIKFLPQRHTG